MLRMKHTTQKGKGIVGSSSLSKDQSMDEISLNFKDSSHEKLFFNHFLKRNIVNGTSICGESFTDFCIERYFFNQGWELLKYIGS